MLCLRPAKFHSITQAHVSSAALALRSPRFTYTKKKRKGARRAGEIYEAHAQKFLSTEYPHNYVEAPWLNFRNGTPRLEWCQPDGLLVDLQAGLITIVEIKLKHTAAAYWQIRHKYEPVLRKLFSSDWQFAALEVVKWFDPDVGFPERFHLTDAAHKCRANRFHVFIWGSQS